MICSCALLGHNKLFSDAQGCMNTHDYLVTGAVCAGASVSCGLPTLYVRFHLRVGGTVVCICVYVCVARPSANAPAVQQCISLINSAAPIHTRHLSSIRNTSHYHYIKKQ